jgi:hypothetical protein
LTPCEDRHASESPVAYKPSNFQAFEQKVQAAHAAVHYKAWLAFSTWGADEDE